MEGTLRILIVSPTVQMCCRKSVQVAKQGAWGYNETHQHTLFLETTRRMDLRLEMALISICDLVRVN